MVSWSRSAMQSSAWGRTHPNTRLMAGAALITLVGLFGLTPKSVFGIELVWPFAALWGAAGWASVGLSIRPMLLLCVYGLFQDMSFVSPFGSFMLVNLVTYGAASLVSETLDVETDPVKAVLVAAFAMGVGFTLMWVMAGARIDYVASLLLAYIVTLILFVPVAPLFRLGGRPGDRGFRR